MYSPNYKGHSFTMLMADYKQNKIFSCLKCNKLFSHDISLINKDWYVEWNINLYCWVNSILSCNESIIKNILE